MFLVLEGPDGAGKTSLSERLKDLLEHQWWVRYGHCGPLTGDPLVEYELAFDDYDPGEDNTHWVVQDRLHWGETVYGPLYRGGSKLTPAMFRHVELYLASRGAVMVHVTADLETLERRQREKNEDFQLPEHTRQVREQFQRRSTHSSIAVDFRTDELFDDSYEVRVLRLLERAAGRRYLARRYRHYPSYLGSLTPSTLLVGERRNTNSKTRPDCHAAFLPYPETSGAYLLDTLRLTSDNRFSDRNLGIVNADELDATFAYTFPSVTRVVALGRYAEKVLSDLQVEHRAVPHPQYVRRFHHHDQVGYKQALKEAVA